MFYGFLLSMWVAKAITSEKLQTYVPFYITQAQYDLIIATPQMTDEQIALSKEATV